MAKAEQVKRRIKSRMALMDYDAEKMAFKMMMSKRTWQRRMAHPGQLTVAELERIERILKTELLREEEHE